MDAQTVGIIVSILGVGVMLIAVFLPLVVMVLRRIDRLTQVVTALANHRHSEDGTPTFSLPVE